MRRAVIAAKFQSGAFEAQASSGFGALPFAFEIIESDGALRPSLASAIGRVAADCTRDAAKGRFVGVGGHVENRGVV
jgi:hypothetical protein